MTDNQQNTPSQSRLAKAGKATFYAANVLFPVGELAAIGKITGRSVAGNIKRIAQLRKMYRKETRTQLTFEEAVAASGRTEGELVTRFTWVRRMWWVAAVSSAAATLLLLGMVLLALHTLPAVTLLRAISFVIMFIAITAFSAARVVICQLRLWQLATRRLTPADGGTFADFCRENDWLARSFNPL